MGNPNPFHNPNHITSHTDPLRICSFNIGGRNSTITSSSLPTSSSPLSNLATSLKIDQDKHGQFDIFLIQETHLPLTQDKLITHPLGLGEGFTEIHSYTYSTDPGAGVAICYSPILPPPQDHLSKTICHLYPDFQGRFLLQSFVFDGNILLIALLYGFSNSSTTQSGSLLWDAYSIAINQLDSLRSLAPPQTTTTLLLAGDLNTFSFKRNLLCYSSNAKSRPQQKPGRVRHAKVVLSTIENTGRLIHINDIFNPNQSYLTNTTTVSCGLTRTGIDHVYVNSECSQLIHKFSHRRVQRSPTTTNHHHLLDITLNNFWSRPLRSSRPRAVLKPLPSFPFRDPNFMDCSIRPLIEYATSSAIATGNWCQSYDLLFKNIITRTRTYAKLAAITMKAKISDLTLLIPPSGLPDTTTTASQIYNAKTALLKCYKLLQQENLYSVLKVTNLKSLLVDTDPFNMSPSTDWFNNVRTRDDIAKIIPAFSLNPYRNISKPHRLKKHFYYHFRSQFQPPSPHDLLLNSQRINLENPPDFIAAAPALTSAESDSLNTPFTPLECETCLAEFVSKFDSSPGKDDIPPAFFASHITRPALSIFICGLINNAVSGSGTLPPNLFNMVIRLLHKPGKSRTSPDGYRPISLMPISLRIIARIICKRLNPLLPSLTNWQQSAYVPGRRMDHGVILLEKILTDSLDPSSTTAILQLDITRAFDSVSHTYLRKVLTHMRIPPSLINLIMLITTSLSAQVIINDYLTERFPIGRGLPQGSALSAILFILCLEPLLAYARSHPITSTGINIISYLETIRKAILQYLGYADDVIIPLTTPSQASAWLSHFNLFEILSGLCICLPKSSLNLVGSSLWSYPSRQPTNAGSLFCQSIRSSNPLFPLANITFAADFTYCGRGFSILDLRNPDPNTTLTSSHWALKASKILRLLTAFKHCPLKSFHQKRQYLLSHLLAKIQHLAFTSPCPPDTLLLLQKASNLFIFDQEVAPIDSSLATLPHPHGLNLVNLTHRFRAFQLSWLSQFLSGSLPPAVDSLIAASLDHFIYHTIHTSTPNFSHAIANAMKSVSLNNNALLDAVLQISPQVTFRSSHIPLPHLHISTPLILSCALSTLISLDSNRVFITPTNTLSQTTLASILSEPLPFSSVILPRPPHKSRNNLRYPILHTTLAAELHPIWHVRDLFIGTPTILSFNPYQAFKDSTHSLTRPPVFLPLPIRQLSPKAFPSFHTSPTFNQSWLDVTFNKLLCHSLMNPLPTTSTLTLNLSTPNHEGSHYPLSLLFDNSEYKPLQSLSIAQLSTLISSSIVALLPPEQQIPCPFQTAHGWSHIAYSDLPYPLPYLSVSKAIFSQRLSLPPFLYNRLVRVLFLMIQRPVHFSSPKRFIMPDGSLSRWSSCPRCLGRLDTQHRLFSCPGLPSFWEVFRLIAIAVIPSILTLNLLPTPVTLSSLSSCGFFPALPTTHEQQASITLFALAFEAVLGTPQSLPTSPCSPSDVLTLVSSRFSSLASSVLLAKWLSLLSRSRPPPTTKTPVIIVLHYGSVTARINEMNPGNTPTTPIPDSAHTLLHQFFPLITKASANPLSTNITFNTIDSLGFNPPIPPTTLLLRPPLPAPPPPTTPTITIAPTHPPPFNPHLLQRIPTFCLPPSWSSLQFFTDGSKIDLPSAPPPDQRTLPVAAFAVVCPSIPALTTTAHVPALRAQTNNTAELLGVITALQLFTLHTSNPHNNPHTNLDRFPSITTTTPLPKPPPLTIPHILTDSLAYVIHHASNAKTLKTNTPNLDLIQSLRSKLLSLPYAIMEYVPAHTKIVTWNAFWNNSADALAKTTANAPRAGIG